MADSRKSTGGKCAICGAAGHERFRPFCSKRCADVDLSKWLGGGYSVPVVELDEKDLDELERFVDNGGLEFDGSGDETDPD